MNENEKGGKENDINNNVSNTLKDIINCENLYLDFSYIDIENIILCLKRDLLLKECSVYFNEIYFNDKNFLKIKKLFKYNFENKKKFKLYNETEKFKCPVKIKNYSNNKYACPPLFVKPYTSFYNLETLSISHSYFNKKGIKKPSFPYLPSHNDILKSIINSSEKEYFNEECEVIMKTNIIAGNIVLKEKFIYFINNNEIKKKYGKELKYLFCSMLDDIKIKDKIIMIKIKDIQEIINRRYIYDYRAFEIFLKNGKSYYFNLYIKENVNKFFENIEKMKNEENNFQIIKNPIKYFEEKKYQEIWNDNKISTYQYLLFVNKFSSRSFNDINQYPIFPWIFLGSKRDESHKKEKKLPKFRELYYPISIKNADDIKDAMTFFEANIDEKSSHPSHYRLHYSTSGYLLSYLVRMSPFTEEQIRFQNNQFDDPSRQLNSIDEIMGILSSSHDNRELIPEYFTTIEFFLNSNYVNFGYRLNDKVIINDVKGPQFYLNSIYQYIYYNRLILNLKSDYKEINTKAYFIEELAINDWIDLIFGFRQWDEKPKKDKLNLFGKYCYRQNINFDKILDKYIEKEYDDKEIIRKIESKKARIINFGQCPEVLFKTKHKESILPISEEEKKNDIIEIFSIKEIDLKIFEKKFKTKFNVATFWLSKNEVDEYIYFLVYEENKKNDENNSEGPGQYILVYRIISSKQSEPEYIIKINEINLFDVKQKGKSIDKNLNKMNSINIKRYPSVALSEPNKAFNDEMKIKNLTQTEKDLSKNMNSEYIKDNNKSIIVYKISPKNCLFDIFLEKSFYFFIGRNFDNSIKIYEKDFKDKTKEGKLKYSIPTDSFVSCFCKKNKYIFFSGHKNGKIYEWEILYIKDKKNKETISNIKLNRDLIAHKDSMICSINYLEKHDILITTSNDGNLFVRKNFNFELLSVFESIPENSLISKIIYTDFDLLYLIINHKERDLQNKSTIGVFTLNGLFLESSKMEYFIDIEPLKNGKIFCNYINSTNLKIFGLNEKLGSFNSYDILSKIQGIENKKNCKISHFYFQSEKNCFYILLDDKTLYMQQNAEFEFLSKGVDKLEQKNTYNNNSGNNVNEDEKIYKAKRSKKDVRNGSL